MDILPGDVATGGPTRNDREQKALADDDTRGEDIGGVGKEPDNINAIAEDAPDG